MEKRKKLAPDRTLAILRMPSVNWRAREGEKRLRVLCKTCYKWEERAPEAMVSALKNRLAGRQLVIQAEEKEKLRKWVRVLEKKPGLAGKAIEAKELLAVKKIYLHPLPLRVWHWVNAFMVMVLIITGIELRIPGIAALPPNSTPLLVHKFAGWAMTVSFVVWFLYGLVSGNLSRHYVLRKRDLQGTFRQAKFYLFSIFRGEENPFKPSLEERFNPLQKLAYGAIMCIFTPVLVITGVLFSDILLFRKYILLLNGMKLLDAIHVMGTYVFVLYLVVHIYMSTLGRKATSHIKAMIVGYEEEPDEPEGDVPHPIETAAVISPGKAVVCQECHEK